MLRDPSSSLSLSVCIPVCERVCLSTHMVLNPCVFHYSVYIYMFSGLARVGGKRSVHVMERPCSRCVYGRVRVPLYRGLSVLTLPLGSGVDRPEREARRGPFLTPTGGTLTRQAGYTAARVPGGDVRLPSTPPSLIPLSRRRHGAARMDGRLVKAPLLIFPGRPVRTPFHQHCEAHLPFGLGTWRSPPTRPGKSFGAR